MPPNALDVLHEDNHLLALNKPAGVPSAHFDGDTETLDLHAKAYLKEKYAKPGNVFLGVVHRLDKTVSGCIVYARTTKAAARLSEQFREHTVRKVYWAVVNDGFVNISDAGTLEDHLLHDDLDMRVNVVHKNANGAKYAKLAYRVLARERNLILVELVPETGRKHQLRVQLASRGSPIFGDTKYGSDARFGIGIALHARTLGFRHPTNGEAIALTATLPARWYGAFGKLLADAEAKA